MPKRTKVERANVSMPQEVYKQINEFRYRRRYPSFSEALVALVKSGLEQNPMPKSPPDQLLAAQEQFRLRRQDYLSQKQSREDERFARQEHKLNGTPSIEQ